MSTIPAPYTPVPWPEQNDHDEAPDFSWQGNYARARECVHACEGIAYPQTELAALKAERDELRECVALASVVIRRIGTVDAQSPENIRRANTWLGIAGKLIARTAPS